MAAQAFADGMRRRHAVYVTRRALEALPDEILHDIGIPRSEIDHLVEVRLGPGGRPLPAARR